MIGDASEDIGEPRLGVDIVELCCLYQRVDDGGALTAAVGAAEQPRLAAERHCPFILPMSAKSGKFTILGIPISGKKSAYGG